MNNEPTQKFELVKYFPLVKIVEGDGETPHTVYGLATCEKVDKDDEICDYAGAKKSYQAWSKEAEESTRAAGQDISLGNIRYMHRTIVAGKVTKIRYDDARKQIWVESTPSPPLTKEDPDVWQLLKGGFLRGYSQGGRYISRVCNECRKDLAGKFCDHCNKNVVARYIPTISEVSVVDNPCLAQATFTLVKSDGSTELKKFQAGEIPTTGAGTLPTEIQQPVEINDADACTCVCAECHASDCAGCSADPKCAMGGKAAKMTKFLVTEMGKNYLPFTDDSGKVSIKKMYKAWASLTDGFPGKRYEGPNKMAAIKSLKREFAKIGKDTPSERTEYVDSMIKGMLVDTIQDRAYGQLNKGMYTVAHFARLTDDLKYLWLMMEYERESEGDESPVTDEVKEVYLSLLDHLIAYAEEQVEEEKAHPLAVE